MTKRTKFVTKYVVDKNATQVAIRAGYSEHTAYSQGSRLLKDVEVRTEIDKQRMHHAERVDVLVDEIVNGLKTIAEDPSAPPLQHAYRPGRR
jgi:phage terminase small subunit